MFVEQIGPADVATQRVDRAVAAHLHHLEHRRARLGGAGEEARAQRVAGEGSGSRPARLAYAFTICAALCGVSGTACTRWPLTPGGTPGRC